MVAVKIQNLNAVLVGGNFPVGSVRLSEFSFRGRTFNETVRLGPAVQGSSGNAFILMLPDRFQVGVGEVDKAEIQIQGIQEVAAEFGRLAGQRNVLRVGQNAQAVFSGKETYRSAVAQLFNLDATASLLKPFGELRCGAVFEFEKDENSPVKVAIQRTEADELVIDMNFDFDLAVAGNTVESVMDRFPRTLQHMTDIVTSFETQIEGAGASA